MCHTSIEMRLKIKYHANMYNRTITPVPPSMYVSYFGAPSYFHAPFA